MTPEVRLALGHLRQVISLRGMARILGIPATRLRDNFNPVSSCCLPDGTAIEALRG